MGPIVMVIQWSAVVRVTIASMTLHDIRVQRVHIKLQDVFELQPAQSSPENRLEGERHSSALSLDAGEYVL